MILKLNELKKLKSNEKMRKSLIKYNYLNIDDFKKLKNFKEINSNRYKNYDISLKDIKLYQLENENIFKLEIENYFIILRDKDEKSFFFNQYYMNEFLEEKEEKENIIDFLKKSNFYILENENIIFLDYKDKNLIKK